jgi:hypothetical protein
MAALDDTRDRALRSTRLRGVGGTVLASLASSHQAA